VLVACTSFEPGDFGPARPGPTEIGAAGWSYDAGVATNGGHNALGRGGSAGQGGASATGTANGTSKGAGGSHGREEPSALGGEAGDGADGGAAGASGSEQQATGAHGGVSGSVGTAGGAASSRGGQGGSSKHVGGASGAGANGGGRANGGNAQGGREAKGGASASGGAGAAGGLAGTSAAAGRDGTGGGTGGRPNANGGAAGSAGTGSEGGRTLWFSEYVEGSGSYKALELRATPGSELGGCQISTYYNGASTLSSTSTLNTILLEGTVGPAGVYVLCSSSLASQPNVRCDRSTNLGFNGNDAVALACDGVVLDVIGQIGVDPGDGWSNGGASTANQTLRRRCDVNQGDANGSDAFDPTSEWVALPVDTFDGLGSADCG
jgi:hypothetical protein